MGDFKFNSFKILKILHFIPAYFTHSARTSRRKKQSATGMASYSQSKNLRGELLEAGMGIVLCSDNERHKQP